MITFLSRNNKYLLLSLGCLLLTFSGITQTNSDRKIIPTGFSKIVSIGINIPFVEFSQTHPLGIGTNFSWSKNRFGLMDKKQSKPFGFIADGGIDYYFGKSETVSGNPYKYNSFIYIHARDGRPMPTDARTPPGSRADPRADRAADLRGRPASIASERHRAEPLPTRGRSPLVEQSPPRPSPRRR